MPVFEQVAQRLFARGEVFVAAARVGVHAPRDADPQPEDFTPVDTAGGDEAFDVGADFLETLRAVEQLERGVELLLDDVILQVGNQVGHVVAPDIDPCEIDGRIGQSEDVGRRPPGFRPCPGRDDVSSTSSCTSLVIVGTLMCSSLVSSERVHSPLSAMWAMILRLMRLFCAKCP